MIQNVTIENFKSFERATLPLAPLTLLIGANASGKSNAIEAMQLLAWLASGLPVNDLLYEAREEGLSLRGGFKDLVGTGSEIALGCEVTEDSNRPALKFSISLGVAGGLVISAERLTLGALVLYDSHNAIQVEPQVESRVPPQFVRRLEAISREFRGQHSQAIASSPLLTGVLSSIFFLDPDLRRMREYSFVQEKRLKRDGSALSSVLRRLTEEEGQKARILEIICSLPEQDICDISYLETPRGEVMVQLHETFGGRVVPREAALLSDGTLRVLAVAAALFSVPPGSVIVIEEIDNGVHPSRAEALLASIQKVAKERSLRVLLTTHNPALLDALPLEAIPDTVACYRNPEKGDSRLVRLEDLESYPELIAQGPVGRLLTKGILDRYLKAPETRDREKKLARDLAWVQELRRQA